MYSLYIRKSAQKSLAKIAETERNGIIYRIKLLEENPRPANSKKLKGRDAYRIRVGNYRVIYEIEDDKLIVLVIAIGHRSSVYRTMN